MNETKLIEKAIEAMSKAYAPYSNFKVGAALLTKSGKVFTGCNVENASFGLSVCAERVAIFSAVSAGEMRFEKLVVVANTDSPASPCGACRQVMSEFGDFEVLLVNLRGEVVRTRVSELLPRAFKLREG
ncbi:MAG: Cytidine deaminase [Thermotoga sp. 50_1627]|uniref:cytidine deaminase n=1 Tax=Pseudothermotoga sp. TaxID=2033661 RepID=UPI00076CB0F2|nr:MAG: Cytidine deaminase [Thermotoga sp. 50_64]KUK25134.1 MAG: Cytidine deaminase [Thermotoga sp. 50_1627]MBC7115682.1 cytidine deaminase [Pseudothermotoga sp.]MDK2923748.1 cytidine deaminase [Pseudothermotoga sp.]HBT38509.1 cytidine deaminase [Pseudothermotoga sp.]